MQYGVHRCVPNSGNLGIGVRIVLHWARCRNKLRAMAGRRRDVGMAVQCAILATNVTSSRSIARNEKTDALILQQYNNAVTTRFNTKSMVQMEDAKASVEEEVVNRSVRLFVGQFSVYCVIVHEIDMSFRDKRNHLTVLYAHA